MRENHKRMAMTMTMRRSLPEIIREKMLSDRPMALDVIRECILSYLPSPIFVCERLETSVDWYAMHHSLGDKNMMVGVPCAFPVVYFTYVSDMIKREFPQGRVTRPWFPLWRDVRLLGIHNVLDHNLNILPQSFAPMIPLFLRGLNLRRIGRGVDFNIRDHIVTPCEFANASIVALLSRTPNLKRLEVTIDDVDEDLYEAIIGLNQLEKCVVDISSWFYRPTDEIEVGKCDCLKGLIKSLRDLPTMRRILIILHDGASLAGIGPGGVMEWSSSGITRLIVHEGGGWRDGLIKAFFPVDHISYMYILPYIWMIEKAIQCGTSSMSFHNITFIGERNIRRILKLPLRMVQLDCCEGDDGGSFYVRCDVVCLNVDSFNTPGGPGLYDTLQNNLIAERPWNDVLGKMENRTYMSHHAIPIKNPCVRVLGEQESSLAKEFWVVERVDRVDTSYGRPIHQSSRIGVEGGELIRKWNIRDDECDSVRHILMVVPKNDMRVPVSVFYKMNEEFCAHVGIVRVKVGMDHSGCYLDAMIPNYNIKVSLIESHRFHLKFVGEDLLSHLKMIEDIVIAVVARVKMMMTTETT